MTQLIDRLHQRSGRPDGGHQRLWLVLGIVVLLAISSIWVIAFSSVLGVRSVTVAGAHQVSVSQIEAAAGIKRGTPLARLDTARVLARVEAIAEIKKVTVGKSYPSSVRIEVTERVAVGYRLVAGAAALVDMDNVQFRTMAKAPAGLPQLQVSGDVANAAATATVAAALSTALAARVALISAPSTESITLTLTDGRTVMWGGTDRSIDKARLLSALISRPGNYFDVSDPSLVISRGK